MKAAERGDVEKVTSILAKKGVNPKMRETTQGFPARQTNAVRASLRRQDRQMGEPQHCGSQRGLRVFFFPYIPAFFKWADTC